LKVLVTGATGFIGARLTERLLEQGHNVTILAHKKDPSTLFTSGDNKPRTIRGDLLKLDSPDTLTNLREVDVVYHLAGIIWASIEELINLNFITTVNLLRSLENVNPGKIVLASTIGVYGETGDQPVDEEAPPRPKTHYGLSKLCAESCCRMYSEAHGLRVIISRLSNVYGPRNVGGVIHHHMINTLHGKPVVVYGSSKQTRDFLYIDDAVNGLLSMINHNPSPLEVFNVCSSKAVTILDLIHRIQEVTGRTTPIDYRAPLGVEVQTSVASHSKARRLLGYKPRVPLSDGLTRLMKYYETTG
jgi:UDP-glucose 4-epimerase